ncbi:hypothetical protein [Planctomicrobium sp. SH527]|uniref:hypothetical protein n=1 Tax=Planctomicrobium sp. SH527 TaxID=3448123 RepID=UPI003F5B14CD
MACTIVFYHDRSGELLTLRLSNAAGDLVNGSEPDELIEVDAEEKPLRYEAVVSEAIAGWFTVQISDARGLLYTGRVNVSADEGIYLVDDPAMTVADLGDIVVDNVTVTQFSTSALAQLAGRTIVVSYTALIDNQLQPPIVRGDTYSAAVGNPIDLSNSDWPDLPDGTTIQLQAKQQRTGVGFAIDGSVVVATGAKVIRFQMTSEQTTTFKAGTYTFGIVATIPNAKPVHLVLPEATLRVLNGIS